MSTTPDYIRQTLSAYIVGLAVDVSGLTSTTHGYAQSASDTWREAAEPLAPDIESAQRAHLSFFVDDRNAIDTLKTRSTTQDEPYSVTPLVIRFLYRLRPMDKTADWDRSARAARAMLGHLLAFEHEAFDVERAASGQMITRTPIAGDSENFMAVEVRVDASYRFSLALT